MCHAEKLYSCACVFACVSIRELNVIRHGMSETSLELESVWFLVRNTQKPFHSLFAAGKQSSRIDFITDILCRAHVLILVLLRLACRSADIVSRAISWFVPFAVAHLHAFTCIVLPFFAVNNTQKGSKRLGRKLFRNCGFSAIMHIFPSVTPAMMAAKS